MAFPVTMLAATERGNMRASTASVRIEAAPAPDPTTCATPQQNSENDGVPVSFVALMSQCEALQCRYVSIFSIIDEGPTASVLLPPQWNLVAQDAFNGVVLWKRKIWSAPVERIDDPILADLIRQKQEELDREVTLLLDRESPRFLLGSTQIYGVVEPELRTLADEILSKSPPATHDDSSSGSLTAEGFAALAREELAFYQREQPEFAPEVQVRDDFARGLMVSRGALLIGASTRIDSRETR